MTLWNILKQQNRAQAQFFFAFQVSFKSRDNHDPAVLEVEASKCFTFCKHSSTFLEITYNSGRPWVKKNHNPPLPKWWICLVCLICGAFIDYWQVSDQLQYLIGVKIYNFNISKVFVIIVDEFLFFEPIFKM